MARQREPGWYPDPFSATGDGERYFDGKTWGSAQQPLGRHGHKGDEPRRRHHGLQIVVVISLLVAVGFAAFRGWARPSSSSAIASASPTTLAVSDATTTNDTRPACHGADCGKLLMGDWMRIATGDCVDIVDGSSSVTFTVVSCRSPHDYEIYFVERPSSEWKDAKGIPKFATPADGVRFSCPDSLMQKYAPRFAVLHPDPAAYTGMWGSRELRICAASTPDQRQSIRS